MYTYTQINFILINLICYIKNIKSGLNNYAYIMLVLKE